MTASQMKKLFLTEFDASDKKAGLNWDQISTLNITYEKIASHSIRDLRQQILIKKNQPGL